MTPVKLSQLAAVTGGQLHGDDATFDSVSIDTRTLAAGQLFVAIRGPHFDGHDYVQEALSKGAAGAMVSSVVECALPQVRVGDTRRALGEFARDWRAQFDMPVVGITGSNGKTTVKEMTASILRQRGAVLATRGNLNNDLGVPLTLLGLDQFATSAVIEMGANHAGEIACLARLARPDVGVVCNAGPAHLEGFGSLEGVAKAKGEMFTGLGPAGIAVLNADDRFADLWRGMIGRRQCVSFGLHRDADFCAREVRQTMSEAGPETVFTLDSRAGTRQIRMPFAGEHNVANALCAAAAAWAAGASLEDIAAGLATAASAPGRLQVCVGASQATILDDTYNANPGSLAAALEVQRAMPGEAWLVLGDMGELGADAAGEHARMGARARESGVARLYATGELARHAAEAFGEGGRWFEDADRLVAALTPDLAAGITVLVKASRSMHFERIVQALAAPEAVRARRAEGG